MRDNKMKSHPEDLIYEARQFIKELETVQDFYFNALAEKIKINELGNAYLFDYVFNSDKDTTLDFEQYLEGFGHKLEDFL